MEDGRHWELSRYYADFYDFQIALLENFPDEAGNRGKQRTLPFMPGPVAHVTDTISNGRRQNLDEYVKKILSMPLHISRCQLVRNLFAPRPGDFEIDPTAVGDHYRLSGASQQSSQNGLSSTASRQSSSGQVNGGQGTAGMPQAARAAHQRGQMSSSAGPTSAPHGGAPFPQTTTGQAIPHTRISGPSSHSTSIGIASPNPGGAMKIKVFFQEDIIAIRVPQDINFLALRDKLKDRLKVIDDIVVQYKDEPTNTFADLKNDSDLDVALQRNPKLALYVNFAS